MATSTATLPRRKREYACQAWHRAVPVPGPGIPRDGDHHVLPAGLPGLDVLPRLRADQLPGPEPGSGGVRRARQLRPDRHLEAPDPELRVRSSGPLQPVVGVQQRGRPRRHRRVRRRPAQHQGTQVPGLLSGGLHPAGRHPTDHRRDGLAEHVRPERRRGEPWPPGGRRSVRHLRPTIRHSTWTGCASPTTRSRGSRCRWHSSR